ncbi:T9SS type A sorting domain-containing protein [bacterium]|nr:MAG: T9SS type A sorting domain-containing protein [bacterium]
MKRARAGLLALLASAALSPALADFPSGGGFEVPNSGMTGLGGAEMSGAGFRAAGTLGGASATSMSGGGFLVAPGILAAQRVAADDLSATHAFPTPFIPSKGHSQITFTRLTAKVTIRIYTISGELIRTLVKDSGASDEISWVPVVNDRGESVASGVYIYHVQSTDGKTRIGKLMVIK